MQKSPAWGPNMQLNDWIGLGIRLGIRLGYPWLPLRYLHINFGHAPRYLVIAKLEQKIRGVALKFVM